MEESDKSPYWKENFTKLEHNELSLRVTAIRETFEETSLLLSTPKTNFPDLQEQLKWRDCITKDSFQFETLCKNFKVLPSISKLVPWAHWITPLQEKYRYDTHFYMTILENPLDAKIKHDGKETTRFDWFSPKEALAGFESGDILLAPPTYLLLSEMLHYDFQYLDRNLYDIKRDLRPIQPHIESSEEGVMIVLPGDELHPTCSEKEAKKRNRFVFSGSKYKFVRSEPKANL